MPLELEAAFRRCSWEFFQNSLENGCALVYLFFVTFFFLFKIIYNKEAYFINYNLQTNEKKLYHPLYPSLRLLKTNPFCLLPRLKTRLPSPDSKAESDKMSKSFGLQNIFN